MSFNKIPRTHGSGVVIIDDEEIPGLGSGSVGSNDFLFIGSDGDDFDLIGGSGHDELEGEDGNDIIAGGNGNDKLEGDAGDDDLDGQDGTDILEGGAGNDILRAGFGHDVLTGDGDADRAAGDAGHDTFGFYASGNFHVTDFKIDEGDRLFFDSETLGIHHVDELLSFITDIEDKGDEGFTVEFVGGAATIELVGVNVNSITADMIVFDLPV